MMHDFGCPVPDYTRVRMDKTKKLTKVQRNTKSFREGRRVDEIQKNKENRRILYAYNI
jgi:hypothetical protein